MSLLAARHGLSLDGWQETVLRVGLGERADGLWAARMVGVSAPRQNGKTEVIVARLLAGLTILDEELIVVSAHRQDTSREVFFRLVNVIESNPGLERRVDFIARSEMREFIRMKDGREVRFKARSAGSGRGFSCDCLLLDEAQILSEAAWSAILPTMSARPNPQVWMFGTPPTPLDDGEVFWRIRESGMSGASKVAYAEWSAAEGDDPDDEEVWRKANPAYGVRISREAVEAERASMDDATFARERLGMWTTAATQSVIDAESWRILADEGSVAVDRMVLGIDVNPERSRGAVALAGLRADGLAHVEVDEQRDGVGWIVGHVEALWKLNPVSAVVVDAGSAAASLVGELRSRQVKVIETGPREMASACGGFYDAVMDSRLRHIGQPQLGLAVAAARKRPLRDAWAWNRKNAASDITTLVAGTLALWGVGSAQVKSRRTPDGGRRESRRKAVVM